jgi:hypothetical protein
MDDVPWSSVTFRLAACKSAPSLEVFGCDLVGGLAVQHALSAVVVGGVEAPQQLLNVAAQGLVIPSTSGPIRPLKRSIMLLVRGMRGLLWQNSALNSVQARAKAGVKQVPWLVST